MTTYFKYLPVELLANIAHKVLDIDALCEVIECTQSFWINLVKRVFPFAYKRDYNWKNLYNGILILDSDALYQADDFNIAIGFYVYEGLVSPKDYEDYIGKLIRSGDNLALSKIIEWYSEHPEEVTKADLDDVFFSGLCMNNLAGVKQLTKLMRAGDVRSNIDRYVRDTKSLPDDTLDFIFNDNNLSSEDQKYLIGYISNNSALRVNILDIITKYKIIFDNIRLIISLLERVSANDKVPVLKYILDSYPQYFDDVDSFGYLYKRVVDDITNLDSPYMLSPQGYLIIRSVFDLLHTFHTYKKLREMDSMAPTYS